jgi:hypothetical protein
VRGRLVRGRRGLDLPGREERIAEERERPRATRVDRRRAGEQRRRLAGAPRLEQRQSVVEERELEVGREALGLGPGGDRLVEPATGVSASPTGKARG